MAEYIELEAAVRAFNNFDAGRADSPACTLLTPEEFAEYLDELPTVDAVPVVRCKDCKYRTEFGNCGHLRQHGILPVAYPYDFCSYGERKDGDNAT